jgi:hypothetical protein
MTALIEAFLTAILAYGALALALALLIAALGFPLPSTVVLLAVKRSSPVGNDSFRHISPHGSILFW